MTIAEIRKLAHDVCEFCIIDGLQVMEFVSTSATTYRKSLDFSDEKYTAENHGDYVIIRQATKSYVVVLWPIKTFTNEATPLVEGGAYFWSEPTGAQIEDAHEVLRRRIEKIL